LTFIRPDILADRKCVHIKLEKDVHAGMRSKLFFYGLSIQDVFGEFAKMIATEHPAAVKTLERIGMRKAREAIEGKPKREARSFNELDHDVLYDLIGGTPNEDETP